MAPKETRHKLFVLASLTCAAIVTGVIIITSTASAGLRADQARLPDFNVITPQGLLLHRVFVSGKPHWKLGFISAAYNEGPGVAVVQGERSPLRPAEMVAEQIVSRSDGSTSTIENIGTLKYDVDPTHQHWHLLDFMSYELRRVADYKLVRPDEKRGFCLGDRFKVRRVSFAGTPLKAVYTLHCGLDDPAAPTVLEGVSVGWGDDYTQLRDGQDFDITGVSPGEYYLIHRVNPARRLKEADYRNNNSSLRLKIGWSGSATRKPYAEILASCTNTDHCRTGTFVDPIR
jgi:hypothetical protein